MVRLRHHRLQATGALAAVASLAGCLPYPVGSTAQPLPKGETRVISSWYIIPDGVALPHAGDSARKVPPVPLRGADLEWRTGIDGASDVAVRFASGSGLILNYKHRIAGRADTTAPATSLVVAGGFVNFAEHAFGELGIMTSGPMVDGRVLYGGLRVMQVAPIVENAVHDRPTAGGFAGIRLPMGDIAISPEVGLYYDHSALGVRRGDLLFVPAVSLARNTRRHRHAATGAPPLVPPAILAPRDTGTPVPGGARRGRIVPPSGTGPRARPTIRPPTDATPHTRTPVLTPPWRP